MWHPRPALDVQLKTNFSFGLRTKSWPDFPSGKNQSSPRCLVSFSWSHLYSMSLGQVFKCLVVSPTQPGPSAHKRDLALPSPAWPPPHGLSPSSSPFLLIPSLYFWTTYNQSYALLGSHAHPTTPEPFNSERLLVDQEMSCECSLRVRDQEWYVESDFLTV